MPFVLVVGLDDEECMDFLRAQMFVVRSVAHPEATDKLLDEMTPDVVIIDLNSSQPDAARFIRDLRFRLDDATSIIVMSALRRQEDHALLYASGADFFLSMTAPPSVLS